MVPIAIGSRLGRYEIRAKLGAGGMAEVFLAEDTQLGRRVALKLLPPETAADDRARRRLMREARAAATLDHPHICSVYEVGETDGLLFIAMQYVEGHTLASRLRKGDLQLGEALSIATQLVDALSEAHARGILHRDIKPANIMVTARGDAKVMDFGLAKPTAADESGSGETVTDSLLSTPGAVIGTVPYMSPEQVRGDALDPRSDLFSVGIVLYEMVSGRRPFDDSSQAAISAAILTREPLPLARFVPNLPAELERIVLKTLRKNPDERYQTAKDLLIDLRALREEQAFKSRLERESSSSRSAAAMSGAAAPASAPEHGERPRSRLGIVIAVAAAAAIIAGGWYMWQGARLSAARAQIPQVASLAEAGRYFEAYDLAARLEPLLPGDSTLAGLMTTVSDTLTVTTDPPGASVYLQRFAPDASAARQLIGTTPLSKLRIARGEYILAIEKDGFAPSERTLSGLPMRVENMSIASPPSDIAMKLTPVDAAPADMVFVPGGSYRLIAWSRPTDRRVSLADFFIDRYEVSNNAFKEFISAGGYLKREYWQHPIGKDGVAVSWADAMKLLVDRTGLSGPREWSNQNPPDGKGDHPVTGVSWYEAAAYGAFRGKQLPTVFEWEKAARNALRPSPASTFMPWGILPPGGRLDNRGNFGPDTWPVTHAAFGMSPFGAYNMAGNVSEWTLNDSSEGFIATGGSWGDPTYTFAQFGGRPGLYSSNKLGFRLSRLASGSSGDQGVARIESTEEIPVYKVSDASTFKQLAATFPYTPQPLDARVEEKLETPDWTREKISFKGDRGERAIAYLYLPKHFPRPLQVIHYIPAADVDRGFRPLAASMDGRLGPFVKSGRAAFGVVLRDYVERLAPQGTVRPDVSTVEFHDLILNRVTDLRIGLDYLASRDDIDITKLSLYAPSAGAAIGLIFAAIESRYQAVAMVGAGLPADYLRVRRDASPIYFAPHIRVPKLIVQGRYDEDTPLKTAADPLYALLSEPKERFLYDGEHVPPIDVAFGAVRAWLDKQLGPVQQ